MKRYSIVILVFLLGIGKTIAQNFLLDLNVRGTTFGTFQDGQMGSSKGYYERDWSTPDLAPSIEVLYFPKSFIGVGLFYSQSVMAGEYSYRPSTTDYNNYFEEHSKYKMAMYGLAAQITTSRSKRFRIYAVGRLGKYEMVENFGDYKLGSSVIGYSAGFGIMVRLSRRLSYNIFEANYTWLPKDFIVGNEQAFYAGQVQSGFVYKVYRKK